MVSRYVVTGWWWWLVQVPTTMSQPMCTIHRRLSTDRCPRIQFFRDTRTQRSTTSARRRGRPGTSDDPFAVLGRHRVTVDRRPGRRSSGRCSRRRRRWSWSRRRRHADAAPAVATGCSRRGATRGRACATVAYRFRVHEDDGAREIIDPYQFGQVLTDFDLHLFSEGTHHRAWEKLGAHRMTIGGVDRRALRRLGAQRAARERDRRLQPLGRARAPDAPARAFRRVGDVHSRICRTAPATSTRSARRRATCCRRRTPTRSGSRCRRNTASIIWTERRATSGATTTGCATATSLGGWRDRPMSVYEVHLGSWRRVPEEGNRYLTYRELARHARAVRARDGLHAHRADAGDGASRSPARGAIRSIGFFAPTSRFGTPDDFRYFVDECHRHGPRRHPRLGARALPERPARARAVRRHGALRARRPAQGRAPGLGHARSSTTAATRCGRFC